MATTSLTATLRQLGWPRLVPTATAVRAFQASTGLVVDGIVGPITTARLAQASSHLEQGRPTLSAHFDLREFACSCRGQYAASGCAGILAVPALVAGLERIRAEIIRGPLVLASSYRCPAYNATVPGAAKQSQHQWGAAADGAFGPLATVRDLRVFSGLGHNADGSVRHVDVRHMSGHNPAPPARGSLAVPAIWAYS